MAGGHGIPITWLLIAALSAPLASHSFADGAGAPEERSRAGTAAAQNADGSWRGRGPVRNGWGPSGIYDPVRERMVIFGGQGNLVLLANSSNLVWELSLTGTPSWTALTTIESAGPLGRQSHSAIYDPVRDRMIIFGGQGSGMFGDVWAFSLSTHAWTQIVPAPGPAPIARQGHSAIYDPVRDRMLVFGGSDASNIDLNDVWALFLGTSPAWTQLTPAGTPPAGRGWHSAIYDPVRDRMVVYAGWVWASSSSLGDTWSLDLSGAPAWSPLAASGSPGVRNSHNAIYDPVGDRMVAHGGWLPDLTVLSFSGSPAWSTVTPSGTPPSLRDGTAGVYDATRQRMVMYGGVVEEFGSAWAVTLTGSPAWSPIAPVGTPATAGVHAIYDSQRDQLVVRAYDGQVWAQSLTGEPGWTQITPSGSPPITSQPSVIHDPPRDRIVVYGGQYTDETWALNLATHTWTKIEPPGTLPSVRGGHSAIYDPIRDRMVVYGGGWGDWSDFHEEIWVLPLDGGSWTQITPTGPEPIAREGHTAIYDLVGDRMVVCGGHDGFGTFRRDVWAFDLDTHVWTEITPTTALPHDVVWATSVYDPPRQRMLLFGGPDLVNGDCSNELWSLALSGTPTWTLLAPSGVPPVGRQQHGAIYDPVRDRMVVYGGLNVNFTFTDLWDYTPASTVSVQGLPPGGDVALTFAPPSPNPARGRSMLSFTLARAGHVALDVFDARGRRVRRLVNGALPAGPHHVAWAGEDDQGQRVASGLYFVRLRCGDHELTRRTVRLH